MLKPTKVILDNRNLLKCDIDFIILHLLVKLAAILSKRFFKIKKSNQSCFDNILHYILITHVVESKMTSHHRCTKSSSFVIRDISGKGMSVVAIRDIPMGELLIAEEPLFVIPWWIRHSMYPR